MNSPLSPSKPPPFCHLSLPRSPTAVYRGLLLQAGRIRGVAMPRWHVLKLAWAQRRVSVHRLPKGLSMLDWLDRTHALLAGDVCTFRQG